jgi:hypothetical protein
MNEHLRPEKEKEGSLLETKSTKSLADNGKIGKPKEHISLGKHTTVTELCSVWLKKNSKPPSFQ